MQELTNFFERRVSAYQVGVGVGAATDVVFDAAFRPLPCSTKRRPRDEAGSRASCFTTSGAGARPPALGTLALQRLLGPRGRELHLRAVDRAVNGRRQPATQQRRHDEQPELLSAQPPTNTAGPRLRAGFTEVLVTGMPTRWISVSTRPMAMPAKPTAPAVGGAQHRQHEQQGEDDLARKAAPAA